ncbi:helix-turn-helix domain-containing protein [Halocatena marina]|uniref:helix-turn-helix domain-containing protein n=1 Tax=Halocatena marina TaxID=2934937 RepID=UPI003621F68F
MKTARNPVKSVQTVLSIIELLQDRGRAGITELAGELGVSKGTVHCHLSTLRQEGYIVKEGKKYCLSLRFVDIAHDVRSRNAIYDIVTDEVDRLAAESKELHYSRSRNSSTASVSTEQAARMRSKQSCTSGTETSSTIQPWGKRFLRSSPCSY